MKSVNHERDGSDLLARTGMLASRRRLARISAMLLLACAALCFRVGSAGAQSELASGAGNEADAGSTGDDYSLLPYSGNAMGPEQPIPFSHAQHAGEFGLPCATCHAADSISASTTADAAPLTDVELPSTDVCMNCHDAVATDSAAIASLHDYHHDEEIVPWARVYEVLAGVNWSHEPHLQARVDCATCHGDVPSLEVMSMQTSVTAMGSCIDCHKASGASSDCQTCHAWPTGTTFETRLTGQ